MALVLAIVRLAATASQEAVRPRWRECEMHRDRAAPRLIYRERRSRQHAEQDRQASGKTEAANAPQEERIGTADLVGQPGSGRGASGCGGNRPRKAGGTSGGGGGWGGRRGAGGGGLLHGQQRDGGEGGRGLDLERG